MVAVNPVDSYPVDYYALWAAYEAGVQPVDTPRVRSNSENGDHLQPQSPKGLDQVFEKDAIVNDWNLAYQMMTTIQSSYGRSPLIAPQDPELDKFVSDRRIEAYLSPNNFRI